MKILTYSLIIILLILLIHFIYTNYSDMIHKYLNIVTHKISKHSNTMNQTEQQKQFYKTKEIDINNYLLNKTDDMNSINNILIDNKKDDFMLANSDEYQITETTRNVINNALNDINNVN